MLYGLKKYMTFAINKDLVFIDSMQFLNSSRHALVKNFSEMNFKGASLSIYRKNGEMLVLVKQRGVYSYEYMNSFKIFFDNRLTDSCAFYSSLKGECISEKDYLHAVNAWNTFEMKTMGDYHDLYLKTDISLLPDVFEKVDWCVNIIIRSLPLFQKPWIKLGCYAQDDWCRIRAYFEH